MKTLPLWAGALALASAAPALAQSPQGKTINAPAGYVPAQAIYCDDGTGHAVACPVDPATGATSSTAKAVQQPDGSKIASDAQLVNAVTQLTAIVAKETAILSTLQGTLLVQQASLPAFAVVPTFNLGTAPSLTIGSSVLPAGAATAAKQDALTTALGSPLQQGGSIISYLPQLTATSRSGVFGTASSQLMPANASRHFIQVQVQSSSASCYISGLATATADQNSLLVSAGALFESSSHVGTGAIAIICTGANTPVFAREG